MKKKTTKKTVKKVAKNAAKKTAKKTVKKLVQKVFSSKSSKTSTLPKIGKKVKEVKGVNIIRKDYLLDQKTIFATARAKRPHDYATETDVKTNKENCVFCPENQDKILLVEEHEDHKGNWQFRSTKNIFGILTTNGEQTHPIPSCNTVDYLERDAYGYAEVVIDTPDHSKELEDLPIETIAEWFSFLGHRVEALRKKRGVRYVSVFKNRGRAAGASISHSHTQIITTPSIPKTIFDLKRKCNEYFLNYEENPYEKILRDEKKTKRFVMENEYAMAFTPFASQEPMEILLFPKGMHTCLTRITQNERLALARMLVQLLKRLNTLGTPPYNLLFINDGPYGDVPFHLRLTPRIGTPQAGFEFITGLRVNPTLPEDAAAFYRGE